MTACVGPGAPEPPPPTSPATPTLPATWEGTLPCADCAGQRWTLSLFDNGGFRLRMTYLGVEDGADRDFFSLGRWMLVPGDAERLRLLRGAEIYRQFRVLDNQRLRLLDLAGEEPETELNYDLARAARPDPVAGPMPLTGHYRYLADAAVFVECDSGIAYPVIIDAGHLPVERAWLNKRGEPGSAVLLAVEGRFLLREPEPGLPARMHLAFTGAGEFRPGDACPR